MIQWVEITNYVGETLHITLNEADPEHGMIIKNIDGLGPPKATINTTEVVTMDGDVFNSSRLQKRNIVMNLLFTFAEIIEDPRLRTYNFFAIKRQLRFEIKTDHRQAYIYGYVETNEPGIFSQMEETQISIVCPYPYFTACGPGGSKQRIDFFGIEPLFEFVYDNNSLEEKLTEFGNVIDNAYVREFTYDGDADVGMVITIHSLAYWKNLRIWNVDTGENMLINSEKITEISGLSPIQRGDDIILNTNPGSKSMYLYRLGKTYNVFNALEKGSDWLKIRKGLNRFAMQADAYIENIQLTIEADIIYEGV